MDRYFGELQLHSLDLMVGMCISSSMAAYAFARLRFSRAGFPVLAFVGYADDPLRGLR